MNHQLFGQLQSLNGLFCHQHQTPKLKQWIHNSTRQKIKKLEILIFDAMLERYICFHMSNDYLSLNNARVPKQHYV